MSFKKEKKMYTESEITLTDINEPTAYLINSHQMLLSTEWETSQSTEEMLRAPPSHQHTTLERQQ